MSNQRNRCVIVVPIYKAELDYDEFHSVSQLFKILSPEKYDIVAIGPMSLDISYYDEQFNFKDYYQFYDEYFKNYPRGYNKLMLSKGFYECFAEYDFMLIYQPDCWVFRDELMEWCDKDYVYIGAPNFFIFDNFWLSSCTSVGNGGFSLRKISWFIEACDKYEEQCDYLTNWQNTMYGEDKLIDRLAYKGIKIDGKVPSFLECAKFSFEIQPHMLYNMIDFTLPFGCHAYNKVMDKYFYDQFICYRRKAFSVVTCAFEGDTLHDPLEIDDTCEYICLTDRDDLTSDVWDIRKIDFGHNQYTKTQKEYIAKYTGIDYIDSDMFVWIDSSVKIKKKFNKYVLKIYGGGGDCVMATTMNAFAKTVDEAYDRLEASGAISADERKVFVKWCRENDINPNECCSPTLGKVMIMRNVEFTKNLCKKVLKALKDAGFNMKNDQPYYGVVFITSGFYRCEGWTFEFNDTQILYSDYLEESYEHERFCEPPYQTDLSRMDYHPLTPDNITRISYAKWI